MEPPNKETELRDFPWVVVRFRCYYCRRSGDARLASLAWRYGAHATLAELVALFREPCPWRHDNPERRPQKYGMRCGAYCPDIGRTSPPDWPPPMMGLSLIEGGKDEQLPADKPLEQRRRRVGGRSDDP